MVDVEWYWIFKNIMTTSESAKSKYLIRNPMEVPVVKVDTDLPALNASQLSEHYLRDRFLYPPQHWHHDVQDLEPFYLQKPLRSAAVLIPIASTFEGRPELSVLLTQRSMHLKDHAGQISFPGGRLDPQDDSAVTAALRETWEEVGIAPAQVDVLGALPQYLTGTAYEVTPVVGMVPENAPLTLQTDEVAEAFTVPLSFLMTPANHRWHETVLARPDGTPVTRRWLSMDYVKGNRRYFIWGATAAMLRNLYWFLRADK